MVMLRTNDTPDTVAAVPPAELDPAVFEHRGGVNPAVLLPPAIPPAGPPKPVRAARKSARRARRRPWVGRVEKDQYGDYVVTLADGQMVRLWPRDVKQAARTYSLPLAAAAWVSAVRRTYTKDVKAVTYHAVLLDIRRLHETVGLFLAEHFPPCKCRVCDLLATLDLTDPAGNEGSRVLPLAHRLYGFLHECNLVFENLNDLPTG